VPDAEPDKDAEDEDAESAEGTDAVGEAVGRESVSELILSF
jgi:hypothetical protein